MNEMIYGVEMDKKNKYPLVSIIIPVYNGSNYMREAIDSALNQDYPNIEVIVVNDGSTDNGKTEEIAKSYGDKIKYYKKENGGVSTALNFGIKKMNGEFFSWLSHDDRYYENKISTQMFYLINHNLLKKKVITYTNYDVIDETSTVVSETHFEEYKPNKEPELAMLRGLVSGTALLIPKSAFDEHGLFDTNYRCVQDYLLFFNFMKTYRYIHIPLVTNSTRVHAAQVTNVNPKVIEENNFLWIKMQEETPDETKIRLTNSLYDFYMSMENYLRQIAEFSHNDYVGAREHAIEKANEYLEKGLEKLEKVFKDKNPETIYQVISNIYNDCHMFKSVDKNYYEIEDDKLQKQVLDIVEIMGLFNIIEYVIVNKSSNNKILYFSMLDKIRMKYPYYHIKSVSPFMQIFYFIRIIGLKNTIRRMISKTKNTIRSNKYLKPIFKVLRLLLKIIFFIPKMIIRFILTV